eukprot:CAMPEP_0175953190 /NCGR_PEP_ID=MMETSP0108-20121206/31212_1 /TAXON_ID=195067 ORGANISM="Goniomonas pacifica, Strain CCMP1869" /NCGR_SAMPLE_ID=MMETSP0108 /ASSEMBLY_ACC=CAM_ASM_000204 /LENGTH=137 /DNA_ID=CAMNT_0017279721 /DNA_START=42 /DNA_END=455 /DNA_ORIENTATION=+
MCCAPRQKDQPDSAGLEAPLQPGVGIVCEHTKDEKLVVYNLQAGGPAEKSGQVHIGDTLYSIEDTVLDGLDLPAVKRLLDGENGTTVRIGFTKPHGGPPVIVSLERGFRVETENERSSGDVSFADRMCQPFKSNKPG